MSDLRRDINDAINRNSAENGSNTPDFILAEYLTDCLAAFDKASRAREKWYGKELCIAFSAPGTLEKIVEEAEEHGIDMDDDCPNSTFHSLVDDGIEDSHKQCGYCRGARKITVEQQHKCIYDCIKEHTLLIATLRAAVEKESDKLTDGGPRP